MSTSASRFSPIFSRLVARATETPDRVAIFDRIGNEPVTFAALVAQIEDCRKMLAAVSGPLAIAVRNRYFCAWFFAARACGLPVILMDAEPSAEAKRISCRHLGIRFLVHQEERLSALAVSARTTPSKTAASEAVASRIDAAPAIEELSEVTPWEPFPGTDIVKLTSGSTGTPSGACFGEAELILGVEQIGKGMGISARDTVLLLLPMTHSYGFDNGALSLALLGTPLVLERRIFPGEVLKALTETHATVLPLVPPLVRALGHTQWPELPHLRRVICAGGTLSSEFAADFRRAAGVPVHNFYGSSETGGICFAAQPDDPATAGTVGSPLPGVRVELGTGGEVRVWSKANLRSRWREGSLRSTDQPVETGDLGEWTADGSLKLTGRTAERLNIGGRKVAAAVIETALAQIPAVIEAAVVGIEDDMRGDRVAAFLVTESWPVDLRALPKRIRPRECYRLDSLPTTARGKLDRAQLRKSLSASRDPSQKQQSALVSSR